MELNELKEKAILLKKENTKLHNEVKAKKAEFAQIIRNNFVEIILPYKSVDACNSFIEQLNADYSLIIESAINQYETENPKLAETLQNLTERIRNSSFVEQKEDGSIEIQINGKTYIGTVKEV